MTNMDKKTGRNTFPFSYFKNKELKPRENEKLIK